VGGFVTIEHALLDHDHAIAIGAAIDDTGTHTAAGTLTTGDEGAPDQMTQDTCGKKFPPTSPYGLTGLYPQA
jgi:hypothetical protein